MDNIPHTPNDVLLLPAIVLLFGVLIYGGAVANGLTLRVLPKYRWAGVAVMILGAVIGVRTVGQLYGSTGDFYRAMIDRKTLLAHYAALVLPLIALALVPVAEWWFRRSVENTR